VLPVLILVGISLFSFRLLFAYHDMPTPDLTVKATGNQWNWSYEYPDQGVPEYVSNMLPEDEIAARGMPHSLYRLAADEPIGSGSMSSLPSACTRPKPVSKS
jgi:cytochrome c oxidase subunit 2